MAWQNPKTDWKAGDIPTASDFNRIEGNIEELENTKETPSGAQAKVDTHAGSKQTHGISSGYYIAKTSRSDQLPAWGDIQGKPSTFPPSSHTHTPGQISPQGAGSGLDADTVRGKVPATAVYGIFTGDDTTNRFINIGFTPKFVCLQDKTARDRMYTCFSTEGATFHRYTTGGGEHEASSNLKITTNGFRVSRGDYINESGEIYEYVCIG